MDNKAKHYDQTEKASERENKQSTSLARQMASDDAKEFTGNGIVPSTDGDSDAENRVATSLDNE